MQSYQNKVVLVTGGATGIGFGLAKRFGLEGAKIAIAGIRLNRLKEAESALRALNIECNAFECNVSVESEVQVLKKEVISSLGHVSLLINNAGIGGAQSSVFDLTDEEINETMNTNFMGTWRVMRTFAKGMIARKEPCGIYNVGSENSLFNAIPRGAAYVASKMAVRGLTTAMRKEAPDFMQVGLICPGLVHTEIGHPKFMSLGMSTDDFAERVYPQICSGQFYVVSHACNQERIDEQYQEVKGAYEAYAPRYEGDMNYDVQTLIERMRR